MQHANLIRVATRRAAVHLANHLTADPDGAVGLLCIACLVVLPLVLPVVLQQGGAA